MNHGCAADVSLWNLQIHTHQRAFSHEFAEQRMEMRPSSPRCDITAGMIEDRRPINSQVTSHVRDLRTRFMPTWWRVGRR